MSAFTLEQARTQLNMWLEAERVVATGQSYQIGSRRLERANLLHIREQIKMWRREVERLEAIASGKGSRRVIRVVPRDL
jgi:hypothetical protein